MNPINGKGLETLISMDGLKMFLGEQLHTSSTILGGKW